ncbi:hypothetical protein F5144DRAFT_595576 [Chaetomium tenue]|uniref:Uncharacterized protein n=1 Tax=Chaetomium tenue TaxID=1854479 RepID=A0ACB7P0F9_9PEZI|nr:hypothetical protein F5144DRAFT_595576 [Chaetomium globosum]
MEALDPTAIRALVENLIAAPCHFILNTDTSPFRGGEYAVYALEDEGKSRRLCLRIPHNRVGCHVSPFLEHEAKLRRRVDAAKIDLFQPLIAHDSTTENSIKAPYLVLGWADGEPALEWITYKIDRKIARAESNQLCGGTVAECEHQKQLIPKYWMPGLDNAPHVLVHGDISGNNIIVGSAPLAVQSIIDLGFSGRNSEQMKRDRAFYLECVKTRAQREGGIELHYYRTLARDDEPSRYWWLTAASRIDIHIAMALCSWAPVLDPRGI